MSTRTQTQMKAALKPSFTPVQGGLLQRKCACGGAAGMSGECEECSKEKRFGLQTKLKINEPGDNYEQEADRIADQVLATPAHHAVSDARPRIQRFSGPPKAQMDAAPASVDQALASTGRPLEPVLRQDMERRFGHDFSRVRVHSGAAAEQSAQDVNAHAYTVGHNIVFGAGQPAPRSRQGRRLLAHELTHVVQQRAGHAHGLQRDAKASEVLPRKAKVIKLGELRYQYDFGRPITKEQAAQVLFRDGKVPDEATLVQGPGNNSWTLQTFDHDGHQATLNKMRARTETVSTGKPTEPAVPGQWNPPPPDELTMEWTEGPSKPRTGPKREDLKNEFGFMITKRYTLDEGQRPWSQLGKNGMGYEVAFDKVMTKAEVMNKLIDKNKITHQGEVILIPMSPEPTPLWKVEVLGADAAGAWQHRVGRAFADASFYQKDSLPSGTPVGVRAHLENKTVPKDAVNPLPDKPDVYVWEQEGYMVYVKTNNKGKDGYYEHQLTKMPTEEQSKLWMRTYMKEQGMPPRQAWITFLNDTIETSRLAGQLVAGAARLPKYLRPSPPFKGIRPPTKDTPDPVLPVKPTKVSPAPEPVPLTVKQGGGKGSGKPTGMPRDTDSASPSVQLPASHTVFKNKLPANDPPTPPQAQAAKVAVNATKDLPPGPNINPAQGLSAPRQNANLSPKMVRRIVPSPPIKQNRGSVNPSPSGTPAPKGQKQKPNMQEDPKMQEHPVKPTEPPGDTHDVRPTIPGATYQARPLEIGHFAERNFKDLPEILQQANIPSARPIDLHGSPPIPPGAKKYRIKGHRGYSPGNEPEIDALDRANGRVYEIKPHNRYDEGLAEAKTYAQDLDKYEPLPPHRGPNGELTPRRWEPHCVTYDGDAVGRYVDRIRPQPEPPGGGSPVVPPTTETQ